MLTKKHQFTSLSLCQTELLKHGLSDGSKMELLVKQRFSVVSCHSPRDASHQQFTSNYRMLVSYLRKGLPLLASHQQNFKKAV